MLTIRYAFLWNKLEYSKFIFNGGHDITVFNFSVFAKIFESDFNYDLNI